MNNKATTGRMGEELVTERLRSEGFLIVERNWRAGRYEIDIIALKGACLHFVEVKTRAAGGWTSPEEAMTPSKCRSLMRAAAAYTSCRYAGYDLQFDLAAVDIFPDGSSDIRYIADVVQSHW